MILQYLKYHASAKFDIIIFPFCLESMISVYEHETFYRAKLSHVLPIVKTIQLLPNTKQLQCMENNKPNHQFIPKNLSSVFHKI